MRVRVRDPGHLYELSLLDGTGTAELRFVKRIGEKFPGNSEPAYAGTTTQEVLRALIDRQKYVDGQRTNLSNLIVLQRLRSALRWLEERAAEERADDKAALDILALAEPESEPTCAGCGHLMCERSHES